MIDKTELGRRLREARQARGLTLKEMDRLSGFSATHISEIERGKTSPTIGALLRIAGALGREASYFIEPEALPDTAHVASEARDRRAWNGASAELLTPGVPGGRLTARKLVIEPGAAGVEIAAGVGALGGVLLSGRLQMEVGGDVHDVDTGAAFYVILELPVRFVAVGTEPVELFMVATGPQPA